MDLSKMWATPPWIIANDSDVVYWIKFAMYYYQKLSEYERRQPKKVK